MNAYVRFSEDLEVEQPDEDAKIRDIVELLAATNRATFESVRHAKRDTHAKGQGFVKGTLTVVDDLPPELAQSLFAGPGRYPVVIRLATEPGAMLDDRQPAARGLAMKVFGVPGDKMAGDGRTTHDFLFNNCPILPLAEVTTYREIQALRAHYVDDPDGLADAIAARDDAELQTLFERLPNIHLLGNAYYSQSAFRYGDYVVKYGLFPNTDAQRALAEREIDADDPPGVLTEWLRDYLAAAEAGFDFRVQLQTDPRTMPIEDASVDWDQRASPYRTVARLHIPAQDPFTPERRVYSEDILSFDPWAGRADLRPLGSINRVRAKAYRASSTFRHRMNARAEHEPEHIDEIPD
ncbi:catalase family protein [Salinisphaera sp. T31B1]|uniref:catalase family protein n=1 Tax=Salinisphaera sp. T31B1 TaxID=727963 RepID=UPI00333E2576